MTLPDLLDEHRRLILAVDSNERQLEGPRPEGFEALASKRWALVRELLLHCAHDESMVLRPLLADSRPHVAAEAARSLAEQERLLGDFKEHVRRWGALAGEAVWADYIKASRALMQRIRRRLQSEESGIYRYLPLQRGDNAAPAAPLSPIYARDARQFSALIFRGTPLGGA
ncbi:hypothetical protein BH10PSE15_BH10PSE15_13400 [soil metagenome]